MIKLRFIALALAYIAGIVLFTLFSINIPVPLLIILMAAGAGISGYFFYQERLWKKVPGHLVLAAAVLLALPFGYMRTQAKYSANDPARYRTQLNGVTNEKTGEVIVPKLKPGEKLVLIGSIDAEPELRGNGSLDLVFKVDKMKRKGDSGFMDMKNSRVRLKVSLPSYMRKDSEAKAKLMKLAHADSYGYRLEIKAEYEELSPPTDPGAFNMKSFLFQEDLDDYVRVGNIKDDIKILKDEDGEYFKGSPFVELAVFLKYNFLETYKHTIRAKASFLTAGATLGARREMEGEKYSPVWTDKPEDAMDVPEMFRRAGVGHVLAVSGLHVSVVALLLYIMFSITGLRPKFYVPVIIAALVIFAMITGGRPSTIRAVIMNSVTLIALSYFRYDVRSATFIGLSLSSLLILIHNPAVLFGASFLLSFGAVLSLVLITTSMEKWLVSLRGFSLIFAFLWFVLMIAVSFTDMLFWQRVINVFAAFAGLVLVIKAGGLLNQRFPKMWEFGIDKLPGFLRSLFIAQFAIQLGMMIPLSAWFFGSFPVAGMVVNIAAIPLVGIIVQLGMLVGLTGLIPGIGDIIAMPFGAASSVLGEIFLSLSWLGAKAFDYPAFPRPTVYWMAIYYASLLALLNAEPIFRKLKNAVYKLSHNRELYKRLSYVLLAVPVLIILSAFTSSVLIKGEPKFKRLTVHHNPSMWGKPSYPVITAAAYGGMGFAVNPGSEFNAKNTVFNGLRSMGAVEIEALALGSVEEYAGMGAVDALIDIIDVRKVYVPFYTNSVQEYLRTIGGDYMLKNYERGKWWARGYGEAYIEMTNSALEHGSIIESVFSSQPLVSWKGFEARTVGRYDKGVDRRDLRYSTKAYSAIFKFDVNGTTWTVVSDNLIDNVYYREDEINCDVLVLPFEIFEGKSYLYEKLVYAALSRSDAEYVIITDGVPAKEERQYFDAEDYIKSYNARFKKNIKLMTTSKDGALVAKPVNEGVEISGYLSGRELIVKND